MDLCQVWPGTFRVAVCVKMFSEQVKLGIADSEKCNFYLSAAWLKINCHLLHYLFFQDGLYITFIKLKTFCIILKFRLQIH